MPSKGTRAPLPFLLEPCYWRNRLARLDSMGRGLLILPRSDLSSPLVEVVEWRLRAHDGIRIWGLRGQSPFHVSPQGAVVREVQASDLPAISLDVVAEGRLEFVFQVPAGRKLEDRVLDVLSILQVAVRTCGVEPAQIQLLSGPTSEPDEFMIASRLLNQGICSLP